MHSQHGNMSWFEDVWSVAFWSLPLEVIIDGRWPGSNHVEPPKNGRFHGPFCWTICCQALQCAFGDALKIQSTGPTETTTFDGQLLPKTPKPKTGPKSGTIPLSVLQDCRVKSLVPSLLGKLDCWSTVCNWDGLSTWLKLGSPGAVSEVWILKPFGGRWAWTPAGAGEKQRQSGPKTSAKPLGRFWHFMGIEAIYNWWVDSNMFQILGIFPLSSRMIKSLFGGWLSYAELSTVPSVSGTPWYQCGYPKSSTGLAWRKGMTWFRLKPPFYAVLCPSMASARDT